MERQCDACGATYEAKRSTSKFCKTASCVSARRRERKRKQRGPSNVIVGEFGEQTDDGLTAHVRAELESAGRLNTAAGRLALAVADRLEHHTVKDTGSAYASLARELSAAMERAVAGARVEGPVDELRQRREAIRNGV